MIGNPSPRTGVPSVLVGLQQQKASQKTPVRGQQSGTPEVLYQQFFSPYSVQQYPASAFIRGVIPSPQQFLSQRIAPRNAASEAQASQAQQQSHRVLDFADSSSASSATQQQHSATSQPYSVESLITPRQRIAPKTSDADFPGQRIMPRPEASEKPPGHSLFRQELYPVQPKVAKPVIECPLQMLAQAAEDAGKAESAKKEKKRKEEAEKRAIEQAKKEKELLEKQRIKQEQERRMKEAMEAEQARQAEFRRQKMEEARLLEEARKIEAEKQARRREEAARAKAEAEAKQKAIREKQLREAEEKRQQAIKEAERKAAEKRKLEEDRKRQQMERERSERAQLQALLEQKRREQKEAEEQKRRKLVEEEAKRRKREKQEREQLEREKQQEEEARKAKEAAELAQKLEREAEERRNAEAKALLEAQEKEKAKKEALEKAKREALLQIEADERKRIERARREKEREAAKDREAAKVRAAAKEAELVKQAESAKEKADVETDFVNLLYQKPASSNVNQEVKINIPPSFELKRRNSDSLQAGSSASPVVNFIKDIPGKPPPDSFPKQPPDKEPDKNDDEEAKLPPPEKKARMKSPSPPPTSTPDENIPVERVHTPEKPTEESTPELPPKELETPDDSSSKNLREVTKSGDGSQGSASPAAAVSEPIRSPTPAVTPPPAITYGSHLTEAQQQSQTIVKMEPDSEGYGDYGGSSNYDSCGNFLAEETAIIDLLCETSSSEDEEPAYFGSDTPDLTFSPVNEEVIDDEDDDEPLDLLLGKRAEEEASESESEAEAEPVTPEPRTPEPRPSDESDNRIETTPNAETTLTDPEPENESTVPESTNLSSDNNSSAINSPSQLSKNVSRDDSSGEGDDQPSSPRPGKAASDANSVLNLLADAALGNHHPPTTSNETNSPTQENITLTNETLTDDDDSSETTLAIDEDREIATTKECSTGNEAPKQLGLENVPEESSPMESKTDPPSVDPEKIDTESESSSDRKNKIANIVESDPGVELTQQKLEVCPPDNTSETSITNFEDQLHAPSKLSCDEEKNKLLSVENAQFELELQSTSELETPPVEEFKVPLTPLFVKEKKSLDSTTATISTVQGAANQHKILEQTKGSSVSEDTTPPSLSGALLANKTQEDNRTPALSQVQEPNTASPKTEKPSEGVNLEREVTQSQRVANQNAPPSDELTVNKTDTMEQLEVDESCLENPKLGLKQQEPGSFELNFSFSESDRESIDSRPGSVLSSPASHRNPPSVASSGAEIPSLEIVPKELLQTEDEEVSSVENIDPESLFSSTKKESEAGNDADDEKEEDLDDTLCAEETILEADKTITETSETHELKDPEIDKSKVQKSHKSEEAFPETEDISPSNQRLISPETLEKDPVTSEKAEIPKKLNPEIKKQEEKDQKTPEQRNSEKPSKNNQVVCTSSNPDKKSSVVPIPPTAEKDIVPVLAPQNAREEQTQGQPVPKIIRVPPSGPSPVDQVKPIEKSASKVKATKTFMPPVGFTPPFSQTVKRKLNIPDKEQSVPVGPARKKMRVPLSQQPKTITQPRVQINPVTDYSQYVQPNAIYQKPQSRYVKLQPAPPTSSASMASFSEERLQLERQRQLEQLELKHLEERRRLEANFKNAPLRRTSTSPLTIVAAPNRHRRVAYSTEQQRAHPIPSRPSILQPQLTLRQPVMEQPIRPRLTQNIQNIQPRAPIDPSRTFRPVHQPAVPRPKQQIRCKLDVKLTNKGFQTLSRTTPSPTGSNGQERVQIQRVIRRSHNTSSNSVQSERQPSKSEERPKKLS